jgi:hypothetical protein
MHNRIPRAAAALVALSLVLAAFAGGGTAAVTGVDTETTDTTYESAVQDGDTLTDVNGSEDVSYTITWTADADTDVYTEWVSNNSDSVIATNDSAATQTTASGTSYINATVTEAALVDAEHDAGEDGVDVYVNGYNNSSDDSVDTQITATLNFSNATAVERISDADVDEQDTLSVEDDSTEILSQDLTFGPFGADQTTLDEETIGVNGSDTTVYVAFANDTAAEDFDLGAEAAAAEKLSEVVGIGPTGAVKLTADDESEYVPVFYEEAPDDFDSDQTYAVLQDDWSGQRALQINLGSDYDDADEVDVTAYSDAPLTVQVSVLAGSVQSTIMGGMSVPDLGGDGLGILASGGIPMVAVGRRRAGV